MFYQLVVTGIAQGSIYALVALGMTILLRATSIINFGHGEFLMLGAFIALVLTGTGVPMVAAIPLTMLAVAFLGFVADRFLIRPLGQSEHLTLAMMTVALSFLLRGLARIVWGSEPSFFPPLISEQTFSIGGAVLAGQELAIVVVTLVLVITFFALFHFSSFGKKAHAASASPRGAALVGINVPRLRMSIWGVAAAIGALAGVLMAPVSLVYPDMGAAVLIRAFAGMAVGGFGHLGGAVVGGILIGIFEQLAGGYVSTAMIDIGAYLAIVVILVVRPSGLFGRREAVRV
jgi:branched-chain amino acid transport system permease protein